MAKFDSNLWYHIYMDSDKGNALGGTSLFNEGRGATFFQPTNLTQKMQKWQFYAVDTSPAYVIRSMDADALGCMGAQYNETTKETLASMLRMDMADDTVYWTIWESKPAGTYYLTNKANGTAQRFSTKGTQTRMDDDTTGENPGQQLAFEPIEAINDGKYSQLNLRSKLLISPATSATSFTTPSTIPTPSITPSPTPSGTANTPATNPSSGGFSTPAKAAIGASVGGIALIALVVLGLFFWRRRKSPETSYHQTNHEAYQEDVSETDHFIKAELATNNDSTTKHKRFYVKPELAANEESTVAHELPLTHAPPAELPVEAVRNELPERR